MVIDFSGFSIHEIQEAIRQAHLGLKSKHLSDDDRAELEDRLAELEAELDSR